MARIFLGADQLANMRQPRRPDQQTVVHGVCSFAVPDQKEALPENDEEAEENASCYGACLTEDLRLFGQLSDLQQAESGDDLQRLQLTDEVRMMTESRDGSEEKVYITILPRLFKES